MDFTFTEEEIKEINKNFNVKTQESFVNQNENKYIVKIKSDMEKYLNIVYDKLVFNSDTKFYYKNQEIFINVNSESFSYENSIRYKISSDWKKEICSIVRRTDIGYVISYSWDNCEITVFKVKK